VIDVRSKVSQASKQPDVTALPDSVSRLGDRDRFEAEAERERSTVEVADAGHLLAEAHARCRDFFAVTAHELRNPITAISGFAQLLLSHWETFALEERNAILRDLVHQSRRLDLMAEDLLTAGSLEAGPIILEREPLRIRGVIEQALENVAMDRSTVELRCPDDLVALADGRRIEQILTNYLSNGLKYGKPPFTVLVRDTAEGVEVRVTDSGAGVPKELVCRLFERFWRAQDCGTSGTGLGLYIARGLAEAHGGVAWYEENKPTGSCFAIRLPQVA